MTCLVECGDALFAFAHHPALTGRTRDYPVDGLRELLVSDLRQVSAGCQNGGFVGKIGQVRAAETHRLLGDMRQIQVVGQWLTF